VGFEGTDRFEIRRRLGAGGMGIVYEAYDRDRESMVALKTLKNLDPDSLLRFKQEFRSVQGVEHPNLVSLGELVAHDEHWFFTMDLVQGRNFLAYVRPDSGRRQRMATSPTIPFVGGLPQAKFDEDRLRASLAELASGLSALHSAGKVHRDVKPSNVLVTSSGHTVLLDFGLAIGSDVSAQPAADYAVGTAAYMSPEQAAVKSVGPPADWYSVGVMLYQALTGHLPFVGTSFEISMTKQRTEPPPPSERCSGIPDDLDELCKELLRFDPNRRPTEEQILRRLGASASPATASHYSHGMMVIGRDDELSQLRSAFDAARTSAVTVVLHGESGIGKSVLLKHFAELATVERGDVVTLTGRCYPRESIPFKALDGVVDSLAAYMARLSEAEAIALLPRGASLLRSMFPVLGRVEAIAQTPELHRPIRDHLERQRRTFVALRELFHNIAEYRRLIIIIDDLQWADSDSLILLGDLLRPPNPPPLLLLVSSRNADVLEQPDDAHTHMGGSLPGRVDEIELRALSDEDAFILAKKLIARAEVQDVDPGDLVRESAGHPLFIDELVRHTVLSGGASRPRLEDAIWGRVEQLPEPARVLLELIVLAGAPMADEALRIASRLPLEEFTKQVSLLRAANLVRGVGLRQSEMVEPYHDRVRRSVLHHLQEDTQRARHLRLSIALESSGGRPELLIRHMEAAGEPIKAAGYAKQAAERASKSLAFDRAVRFYEAAIRLGAWDEEERRALNVSLSDALVNAGRGAEAAAAALRAAEGADRTTRLECKRRAAEQLLICGHVEPGLEALKDVLAEVSVKVPASPRRALAGILWNRAFLRLRGLRWTKKHKKEIAASELLRVDVFKAASHGLSMVDNVRGAYFQVRALRLALDVGEYERVARAFGLEAVYLGSQGSKQLARAKRLSEQTHMLAEENGGAVLTGWSLVVGGILHYFSSEFRLASDKLQRSVDVFREDTTGRTWELNNARMFHLFALRHLGAFASISELYDEYLRDAARRGDRYFETSLRLYGNEIFLARDNPEAALANLERGKWGPVGGLFHLQHWYELEARAESALYMGRASVVHAELSERFDALHRSLLTRIQIVRCLAAFLQGKLAVAAAAEGGDRAGLLREAVKNARVLEAENIGYAKVWGAVLRAGIARQQGRDEQCVAYLRAAVEAGRTHEMRFYRSAALYRLGELLGGNEGAELVGDAVDWMSGQLIVNPEGMVNVAAPGCAK